MNRNNALVSVAFVLLLLIGGQISARVGALRVDSAGWINPWYIASYACLLLRGLLWIGVLSKRRLVWAYPILALANPVILAISHLLFGEPLGPGPIVGASLIVIGVSLMGRAPDRSREGQAG